jgi:hypothetical protein
MDDMDDRVVPFADDTPEERNLRDIYISIHTKKQKKT